MTYFFFVIFVLFICGPVLCKPVMIAISLLIGFGGIPGSLVSDFARYKHSEKGMKIAFIMTTLGQSFVMGACIALLIGLLYKLQNIRPDLPSWPIWISIYIYVVATPSDIIKNEPDKSTFQYKCLGHTSLISLILFLMLAFVPQIVSPIYSWVPYSRFVSHVNKNTHNKLRSDFMVTLSCINPLASVDRKIKDKATRHALYKYFNECPLEYKERIEKNTYAYMEFTHFSVINALSQIQSGTLTIEAEHANSKVMKKCIDGFRGCLKEKDVKAIVEAEKASFMQLQKLFAVSKFSDDNKIKMENKISTLRDLWREEGKQYFMELFGKHIEL